MAEGKRRRKRFQASASRQQSGENSRPPGNAVPNPCRVFVANISFKASTEDVKNFFEEFGAVKKCQIVRDHRTRQSRGFGFVTFESVDAVARAMSATEDQLILDGRMLRIDRPTTKKLPAVQKKAVSSSREAGDGCTLGEGGDSSNNSESDEVGDVGEGGEGENDESLQLTQHTSCSVPELVDDVLLLILCLLNIKDRITVERVSRQWCRVAQTSWQYVHHVSFINCFHSFHGKYGALSDDILHCVLKRGGKYLTSLDLSSTPKQITDRGLNLIGMYCTHLEKLDLSGISVTQSSFRQLSQRCTNITWLKVNGCHTVGEKCVWWGLHNLKQLQFLDVSDNRRLSGQCFYMAGNTLHHVHLQYCDKLVDSSIELLTARCPDLETLDISHCPRLTGATIRSITQHCKDLKALKFDGPNDDVTISDMMTIGHLHRLEVLSVSQQATFGDETLKLLGRECLNIRTLNCAACYGVSDAGISCLSSCHQLCDLTISYCHLVTDQGLVKILHSDMKRICVRACHGITDYGIAQIARVCLQLRELDMGGCLAISDKSLCSLQDSILHIRSPQHRYFTLIAGGSSIADKAVLQFATTTGALLDLYDHCVPSLSADYDSFLFMAPLEPCEEDEEVEGEDVEGDHTHATLPTPHEDTLQPTMEGDHTHATLPTPHEDTLQPTVEGDHTHAMLPTPHEDTLQPTVEDDNHGDYLLERAEDFLVADDPALFSDEFSEPEEWGFG